MAALLTCGLATTWHLHRTAASRADLINALGLGGGGSNSGAGETHRAEPAKPRRVVAEGRLVARPGTDVILGAEIGGKITRLTVEEKSVVYRGDLIAEIDADEQVAAVAEAEARVGEVDADIRYFEPKLARARSMASTGAVSVVEMEQWQRDLDAARARRVAAVATLRRLQIVAGKAQVRAPFDGTVIARYANPGQVIEPDGRLIRLANLSQSRVEVEVNEFDADGLVVGGSATITAEGYPGRQWRARVEEIPEVISGRQLRPSDPGRPTDTGVLLVKLMLLEPAPFKLGQRIDASIELVPPASPIASVHEEQ
jgi:multidrug efflux pump subunit AcrA (membrane-fusion protein)